MHLPKRQANINYYQEHKVLDSQFHQHDTISHTRRLSSRYIQAPISPQQSPQGGRRLYPHNIDDSIHPSNPTEAVNNSSVDHHHGLGDGSAGNRVKGVISLNSHNLDLGLTSQYDVHAHAMASSEPLILKSDSTSEQPSSIFSRKLELSKRHEFEDIIGITDIENPHNFTLDSLDSPVFHTREFNQPLESLSTFRSDEDLISGIDDIIEPSSCKGEQYVPVSDQAKCFMNNHMQNRSVYSSNSAQSDFHSAYEEPNPWSSDYSSVEINSLNEQLITPPSSMFYVDDFLMNVNRIQEFNAYMQDMTETVFGTSEDSSSLCPSNFFKFHAEGLLLSRSELSTNSHIDNDETDDYHDNTPSQPASPSMYKPEQWSPDREECQTPCPIGGVKDINENFSQSTASDIYTHRTPSARSLSDKSAIKVSLNGTESTTELQPGKSKPHLLPQKLDIYWIGPEDDNTYSCIYENCGKKFTRKYNVRTHIQTHIGDRPFVCKLCGKGFVRRHDFNRHTRLHTASQNSKKAFGNSTGGDFEKCNEWSKYEVVFDSRRR